MADSRWWLKPGDRAWVGIVTGRLWELFYSGDDGSIWSFLIRATGGGPSFNFRFDHQSPTLIVDRASQIRDVLRVVHQPIQQRIGALVQPASLHRRILDEIARQLSKEYWVDGAVIRSELRPIQKEITAKALSELIPRYVTQHPSSDFHGSIDAYTLTLAGALASNRTTEVSRTIEAALTVLREKFDQDPTFRNYRVSEVAARLGFPTSSNHFVQSVLTLSGLTYGGSNQGEDYVYGRPKDTEDLSELNNFSEFLDYLRAGKSDRPSPSAPLILPDDTLDLVLPDVPSHQPVVIQPREPRAVISPSPPAVVSPAPLLSPSKEDRLITRIWRDPVWSKIIANGIWWAGGALLTAILVLWARHHFGR